MMASTASQETLREVAASSVEVDQLTAEHERLQAQTRALDQLSALIRDQATLDRIRGPHRCHARRWRG